MNIKKVLIMKYKVGDRVRAVYHENTGGLYIKMCNGCTGTVLNKEGELYIVLLDNPPKFLNSAKGGFYESELCLIEKQLFFPFMME